MVAWTEAITVGKDKLTDKDVREPHLLAFLTDRCQDGESGGSPDPAPVLRWGHSLG